MSFITFLVSLLLVDLSIAGYVIEDDYSPSSFFSMFSFFTSADPTNGFVDYVDQSTAQNAGYINASSNSVYIGTDHQNQITDGNGRPSVRLTSNKAYNSGSLVILDLAHMPGGICGTWPAFWMVGPNWPAGGEIDIIEGVNMQTSNAMTLHTSDGCSIEKTGDFSGSCYTDDCYIYASDQSANTGCQIDASDDQTYGSGFNQIGGGVYATDWTNSTISVYFFPRNSIPSDISSGSPDPSGWGTPLAQFQGGCDIENYFTDNNIVFDLTFCGDWAGSAWTGTCAGYASTCNSYVADNPSAFEDAYWEINALKVYKYSAEASYTSSAVSSSYAASTSSAVASASSSIPAYVSTSSYSSYVAPVSSSKTSTASSSFSTVTSSAALSGYSSSQVASSSTAESSSSSSPAGRHHHSSSLFDKAVSQTSASSSTSTASVSASSSSPTPTPTSSSSSSSLSSSTQPLDLLTAVSDIPASLSLSPSSALSALSSLAAEPVPTAPSAALQKAHSLASAWSLAAEPSAWQAEISALEAELEVRASQAAEVSAAVSSAAAAVKRRGMGPEERRSSSRRRHLRAHRHGHGHGVAAQAQAHARF